MTEQREREIALAWLKLRAGAIAQKLDTIDSSDEYHVDFRKLAQAADIPPNILQEFLRSIALNETHSQPEQDQEMALAFIRGYLLILISTAFEKGGINDSESMANEIGVPQSHCYEFLRDNMIRHIDRYIVPE